MDRGTGEPSRRRRALRAASGTFLAVALTGLALVAPGAFSGTPSPLVVDKNGTLVAHHGDILSYTFEVRNTTGSPLHAVAVSDNRCAPVTSTPTSKVNDDGDADLDNLGPDGVNPERWIYSCSYELGAHLAGEADPITNLATVTALNASNQAVTPATNLHQTDVLHPAITVDNLLRRGGSGAFVQGPIAADPGETIGYQFVVTRAGDADLGSVAVSDSGCDPFTLTGPTQNGGDQDDKLEPGETWTWQCTRALAASDRGFLENDVGVQGTDILGQSVTDGDSAAAAVGARCFGREPTIVGTPGPETLPGTPGADVILALGGNDRADGGGGTDRLCGLGGGDRLRGGGANDKIDGGNGRDVLRGQGGNDRLDGGPSKDVCAGGPGNRDVGVSCESKTGIP
jgi:hypothetical protein